MLIVQSDGTEGPVTITATSPSLRPTTTVVNANYNNSIRIL